MTKSLDSDWVKRAFALPDGYVFPDHAPSILRRAPLFKVVQAIPLSPLAASLLELELDEPGWHKLAASERMAGVASRWKAIVDGSNFVCSIKINNLLGNFPELTKTFKTFDDFKGSIYFRMLTSELSLKQVFDEHERVDRDSLDLLFEGLSNATSSPELRDELAKLARARAEGKLTLTQVFRILIVMMTLLKSLDAGLGISCRYIPPARTGLGIYTDICRIQKGEQDALRDGLWMVKGQGVNLRAGSSSNTTSLGILKDRQPFKLLQDPGSGWLKVRVSLDGVPTQGWVNRKFAAFVKPIPG